MNMQHNGFVGRPIAAHAGEGSKGGCVAYLQLNLMRVRLRP